MLTPPTFEHLMRQVVYELVSASFILQSYLDAWAIPGVPSDTIDQLSRLTQQLTSLKKELRDPDGTIAELKVRIKSLEDRQAGGCNQEGRQDLL
jgi:hypothetical protein